MVLTIRPYSWMTLVNWFVRDEPCSRAINTDAGMCPEPMVLPPDHVVRSFRAAATGVGGVVGREVPD